jgi:hypothetical protein
MQLNLKNNRVKLSIVIVNFNTKDLLAQCLDSLYSTVRKYEFEIIVVDNNSYDDSVNMIKNKYPEVYLIENKKNVGFACANNQGMQVGKGDYFLLLNPDTIVCEDTIDKIVDFMESNPKIGVMGPKVLNKDGTIQPTSCGNFPTLLRVFLWQVGLRVNIKYITSNPWYLSPTQTKEVDWVSGVCMLIRKKILEEIGFLDESFFSYFEDTDFCYRARKKGWDVYYFDEAKIIHLLSQSWGSIGSVKVKLESEMLFLRKHYGRGVAFCAILFTIYGSIFRLLIWKLIQLLNLRNKELAAERVREHRVILRRCFLKSLIC